MAIPALVVSAVASIMNGPVNKIIDAYVHDQELRRRLKAELESNLVLQLSKSLELGQAVVMAEVKSEHWLTRSWRPLLMLTLTGFLIFAGFILPLADMLAGRELPFSPRWQTLPDGFWDFLSIGVGGYIGGRSLEKIAGTEFRSPGKKP